MKKRTLLIAGLLLAASIASCGEAAPEQEPASSGSESAPSTEESVPASETETEPVTDPADWTSEVVYTVYPEPEFPDSLDLTGKTFRIVYATGGSMFVSEGLEYAGRRAVRNSARL